MLIPGKLPQTPVIILMRFWSGRATSAWGLTSGVRAGLGVHARARVCVCTASTLPLLRSSVLGETAGFMANKTLLGDWDKKAGGE